MYILAQSSPGGGTIFLGALGPIIVLAIIGFLIYRILTSDDSPSEEMVCRQCESVGTPEKEMPGNLAFGCALFFFFVVPGILYSIWRLTNKTNVCQFCGSEDLVPKHSPAGERIIEEHNG